MAVTWFVSPHLAHLPIDRQVRRLTAVHLPSGAALAFGRGSLRLTPVDVVVDVGVCYVSVAFLGETDSTAICQLRSQIDATHFKPRKVSTSNKLQKAFCLLHYVFITRKQSTKTQQAVNRYFHMLINDGRFH